MSKEELKSSLSFLERLKSEVKSQPLGSTGAALGIIAFVVTLAQFGSIPEIGVSGNLLPNLFIAILLASGIGFSAAFVSKVIALSGKGIARVASIATFSIGALMLKSTMLIMFAWPSSTTANSALVYDVYQQVMVGIGALYLVLVGLISVEGQIDGEEATLVLMFSVIIVFFALLLPLDNLLIDTVESQS